MVLMVKAGRWFAWLTRLVDSLDGFSWWSSLVVGLDGHDGLGWLMV